MSEINIPPHRVFVTLGSGANVFLGNVTNNTTVNSLKLVTLGDASINGNLFINKDLNVTGNLSVNQYQTKQTITTLNYQLQVVEDLSINGRLFLNGNASVTGLTTTGSVGIGTNNPASTLHVAGNAAITGDVSFGSRLIMSTNNFTGTVTPNSTAATSSTWVNNGVTWTSSTSSTLGGYDAFRAFNAFNSTPGYANGSQNTSTTTTPTSFSTTLYGSNGTNEVSAASSFSQNGEWLQIQSSVPATMKDFNLVAGGSPTQVPRIFYIAGSTNGTIWYPLSKYTLSAGNTVKDAASNVSSTITISTSNQSVTNYSSTGYSFAANAYNYFRLITLNTYISSNSFVEINEWNINFTPTTSAITLAPSTTAYGQLVLTGDLALSTNISTVTVSPNSTAAASATYSTSTNSTLSWSNNGVTWSAAVSCGSYISGGDIRTPEKAFNAVTTGSNGWLMANNTTTTLNRYNGTNSTYAGTATQTTLQNSVGTTNGEWIQINSSVPIVMKDYQIYSGDNTTLPKTYFIAGSSDNSTYYPIIKVVMTTNPSGTFTGVGLISIPSGTTASGSGSTSAGYAYTFTTYGNGQTAYFYFRMITTQVSGSSTYGVDIGEWNINFTPPTTSAITLAPSTTTYGQLNLTGGLTTTQNVGIGTTNPQQALDVNGSIRVGGYKLVFGSFTSTGSGSTRTVTIPGLTTINFFNCNSVITNGTVYAYYFITQSISGNVVTHGIRQQHNGLGAEWTGDPTLSHYMAWGN